MSIESEEFYNLCQTYRHAPLTDTVATIEAYNNLIAYIDNYKVETLVKLVLDKIAEKQSGATPQI
jgi:hypothetical protein